MQLKTLFACASFVAATVAQISQQRIAFTQLPTEVQAGKPVTLQWGGGDGSPVTITLQQGPTTNLKTVQVITGDATGNSYSWTPSSSLPNAEDYALKIEQGDQTPNYTGMITLTGGSSSSGSVTASSASAYVPSTASVAASTAASSAPTGGAIGGSTNSTSSSTPIVNANSTTTAAPVGTGAVGTGAGASGSAATGTSLHRNTTLSKATLTASSTASSSEAATTSSGSETSSGPAPSSSSKSGSVVSAASNFALLCAAVVGVVYLG